MICGFSGLRAGVVELGPERSMLFSRVLSRSSVRSSVLQCVVAPVCVPVCCHSSVLSCSSVRKNLLPKAMVGFSSKHNCCTQT